MVYVNKVINTIQQIFQVDDRTEALKQVLMSKGIDVSKHPSGTFPIVVPVSAKNAFSYRRIAGLSKEAFNTIDEDEVRKLAKEAWGTKVAKKLSKEELFEKTFAASRDDEDNAAYLFGDSLEATGFPDVIKSIQACLAGYNRQGYIISQQLRLQQGQIPVVLEGGYTIEFKDNVEKQLDCSEVVEDELNFEQYVTFFDKHLELAKDAFKKDPNAVDNFQKCFDELEEFENVVPLLFTSHRKDGSGLPDEELSKKIDAWTTEALIKIFKGELKIIKDKFDEFSSKLANKSGHRPDKKTKWDDLSDCDWSENLEAVKLVLDISTICNHLPKERKAINSAHNLIGSKFQLVDSQNATDFSWVSIGKRLETCLGKSIETKKEKKLETQIVVAAQRSNQEQCDELRGLKRLIEDLAKDVKKIKSDVSSIDKTTKDLSSPATCSNSTIDEPEVLVVKEGIVETPIQKNR